MAELIEPSSLLAADDTGNITTLSPIFILSEDILSCIFEIISRTETWSHNLVGQERPLNTVRACSQVCQSWRLLLLDSPSIWGRCVNLNVLGEGKSEWWEEVLRRTQSSPLWVVGEVPESTSTSGEQSPMDLQSYFTQLLRFWERIQKLNVVIRSRWISNDIQNMFLSPAPTLTVFDVYTPWILDSLFLQTLRPDSTESLFANHAPLLVDLNADMIAFRTDSPWLSNVRDIHIPNHIDVPGVLDLLSRTPLLETLFLPSSPARESWHPVAAKSSRTRINLPHLTTMYLTDNLESCTAVIDHVSPAKDCSLAFQSYDSDPISSQVPATLKERLPTYIVNYFTTHSPTEISLRHHEYDVLFVGTNTPAQGVFFESKLEFRIPEFAFRIPEFAFDASMSIIQAYISASKMAPSLFNTVTKLKIESRDLPTSIIPELYAMLLSFQSAEHITTNDDGIRDILKLALLDYQFVGQPVLFPKIHTLQMEYLIDDPEDENENENQSLLQFLEGRKNAGLAVTKLDLTLCTPENLRDISDLERVHGLEVVWASSDNVTVSYVCGRGEPERLRFALPPQPKLEL